MLLTHDVADGAADNLLHTEAVARAAVLSDFTYALHVGTHHTRGGCVCAHLL